MNNHIMSLPVWQTNKQKPKRRFVNVIVKLFWLLFGVLIAVGLLLQWQKYNASHALTFLPIEHIEITHELSNARALEVINVLKAYKQKNFFLVNVGEMRQQLLAISWVDQVAVSRVWPNRLDVAIAEAQPVAVWQQQHVNLQGKVFSPDNKDQNLPVFHVAKQQLSNVLTYYKTMQSQFWQLGLSINEVAMDSRGSMQLMLSNQTKVILGTQRWLEKSDSVMRILESQRFANHTIDMRYENGFAIATNQQSIVESEGK